MTIRHSLLLAGLLLAAPAFANDAPASDESIREMLAVTDAHKLIDTVRGQVDAMMKDTMQQALHGKAVPADQQVILDRMRTKMAAVVDEVLDWNALQSMYIRVYRASLTQDELDGILAFYRTPAGQAMINKMPAVMQNVMSEMKNMMGPMQQKLQQIQRETLQEMKDATAKPAPPAKA
jgi:hypothetical protein